MVTKEKVEDQIDLQVINEVNNLVQNEIRNVFANKFEQLIEKQVDESVTTILKAQVLNIEENVMNKSKTFISSEVNEAVNLMMIKNLEELKL